MAVTNRNATRTLNLYDKLQQVPYQFDFYHTMRLLECVHPDSPRIGEALRPENDPVRFGQTPSTIFAPSTIDSFSPAKSGKKPKLSMLHFGLFGPNGPLPLHLTEYARDRINNADDTTFSAFADLFHHRLLSLFYRAWANAEPSVSFDRPDEDHYAKFVAAAIGMAMPSYRTRDDMPDLAKLHYSGWFSCQTRNADGLEAIIQDFFKIPTRIEQFVGHRMEIPPEGQFRLGKSKETGALGLTTTLGKEVWDRQSKFRVVLGPLNKDEYANLLPGKRGLKQLVAIVKNYVGDEFDWDIKLQVKSECVQAVRLGKNGKLGWNCWMSTQEPSDKKLPEEVRQDLVLNPFAKAN